MPLPPLRSRRSLRRTALAACAVLVAALAGLLHEPAAAATTLLNVSYDVSREFYKDYNALFAAHWKKTAGEDLVLRVGG